LAASSGVDSIVTILFTPRFCLILSLQPRTGKQTAKGCAYSVAAVQIVEIVPARRYTPPAQRRRWKVPRCGSRFRMMLGHVAPWPGRGNGKVSLRRRLPQARAQLSQQIRVMRAHPKVQMDQVFPRAEAAGGISARS